MKRKIIFTIIIILTLFAMTTVSATSNNSISLSDAQTANNDTVNNHVSPSNNLIADSSNNDIFNKNYDVDEAIKKNTTTIQSTKTTVKKDNSNTYYINNSVQNDGNGSKERPWKNMNQSVFSNMTNGSTVYIANGVYRFNSISTNNITIIGEDMNKTIINASTSSGNDALLNLEGNIIIKNITFSNCNTIVNHGNSNISNVRFIDFRNSRSSSCINNYGNLNIDNSHFINITSSASIIYNEQNVLININNCTFINCGTSNSYGGILNLRDSRTNIRNSRFINSSSEKGVIYIYRGTANLINSNFLSNNASLWGGVLNLDNTNVNITSCTFTNNHAPHNVGGVIYSYDSNLIVNKTVFTGNTANLGGAITVLNGSGVGTEFTNTPRSISVINSSFNNNSAVYEGGAIFDVYSNLTITSSNFTNNHARSGGAIYADCLKLTIKSSKFTNNHVTSYGGAIYSNQNNISITNNNFTTNYATYGDDLYSQYNKSTVLSNNNWSYNNSIVVNITQQANLPTLIVTEGSNINTSILPSKYDLRDYGWVTSIKNQGSDGNCWAFATMATLESCILKSTNQSYDLSENNMKNLMQLFSQYGWCISPNFGGYDDMSISYLVNWYGPVVESLDPYTVDSTVSPLIDSLIHITNVYGIPSRTSYTDNNLVKEAIMKYGAVFTDIRMSYSGSNSYYTGSDDCNHAVAIVGWDDTYNRTNFATTAPDDGAFIIKNSWGSSSGDNGYFYVSYYDTSILKSCDDIVGVGGFTFILNDSVVYDNIYQYDYGGISDWIDASRNSTYSNEYTIKGNESLRAFGTYVSDINARYTLRVYINNRLNYIQNGKFTHLGYETVKLNRTIPVNTNDTVKIELNLQSSNSNDISIPVSTAEYTRIVPTSKSLINNYEYSDAVAILKLYTTNNSNNTNLTMRVDVVNNKVNNSKINVRVYSGRNTLNHGTLTIREDNSIITRINITNDITTVTLPYTTSGEHELIVIYNNINNQVVNTSITMNIIKINSNLTVNRISDIQYNKTINITGKLLDETGIILNNQRIIITINNKNNTITTNNNGEYSLQYKTQTIGTNIITITYNGNNIYNPSTKNIQFNTTKINTIISTTTQTGYLGRTITLNASIKDSNNNPITRGQVLIKLNNKTHGYTNITSRGIITYKLNLTPEKYGKEGYIVTFIYGGTNITESTRTDTTLKVIPFTPKITLAINNTDIGDTVIMTVKITNGSGYNALSGNVQFKLNGLTYKVNKTAYKVQVTNGTAVFRFYASKKFIGYNNITILYSGNGKFNQIKQEYRNALYINKYKQTVIHASPINIKIGQTVTFTARFTDKNGVTLTKGSIAIKINGKTFGHANITNGVATFKLYLNPDNFSAKTYTITYKFGGKGQYAPASTNTTLTITKYTSRFTYNTITATRGTNTRISVKIADGNINTNNGTVGLKINGNTYKINKVAVTVKPVNGVATFTINTRNLPANNNLTFTYSGDKLFNGNRTTYLNGLIIRN